MFYDGIRDFAALGRDDQRRFATYLTSVLRSYENILYQARRGALAEDAWEGMREHLRYVVRQPGTQAWWRGAHNLFNCDLRDFVQAEIGQDATP